MKSSDTPPTDEDVAPLGWHSRGYLPHLNARETLQAVTFRLADSLPQTKLRQLARQLERVPQDRRDTIKRKTVDAWLDAGIGCCALQHPEIAMMVQQTLLRFDSQRYRLLAWCIMPNHVHVLVEPLIALSRIVQSWKSYTGRVALARNAELGLGVPGVRFWMRDYWDRYIRDQGHLDAVIAYTHANPVAAGLCAHPEDWPWSSACRFPGNAEPQLG